MEWLSGVFALGGTVIGAGISAWVTKRVHDQARADAEKHKIEKEEAEATTEIISILKRAVNLTEEQPQFDGDGGVLWDTFLAPAHPLLMSFRSPELRNRLRRSLDLAATAAWNNRIMDQLPPLDSLDVCMEAYDDALACLGANKWGEPLPDPSEDWQKISTVYERVMGDHPPQGA
jgi:hypothetical protein